MKRKRTIGDYFKPLSPKICHSENEAAGVKENQLESPTVINNPTVATPSTSSTASNDIGQFVGKIHHMTDAEKLFILDNAFIPGSGFVYPHSIRKNKGKDEKRFLKKEHFDRHPFLTYSVSQEGLFCRVCAIFAPSHAGHTKSQKLGKLVVEPLSNYGRLLGTDGYLDAHVKTSYHENSLIAAKDFKTSMMHPSRKIINMLDADRRARVMENRSRLVPIIKTVIFCGRQGLSMRGHRDSGELSFEDPSYNDGNFRALLRFRADAGDSVVRDKIINANKNCRYISPEIQNELIEICGNEVLNFVVENVKESGFYSVLADETTDINGEEQLTILLRYYSDHKICEDILK